MTSILRVYIHTYEMVKVSRRLYVCVALKVVHLDTGHPVYGCMRTCTVWERTGNVGVHHDFPGVESGRVSWHEHLSVGEEGSLQGLARVPSHLVVTNACLF